jgi:hypothetical protein
MLMVGIRFTRLIMNKHRRLPSSYLSDVDCMQVFAIHIYFRKCESQPIGEKKLISKVRTWIVIVRDGARIKYKLMGFMVYF